MTVLSAALTELKVSDGILRRYPVKGGQVIYTGSLVTLNSTGYAVPATANCASGRFAGIAMEGTLTGATNVADGDQTILVFRQGLFLYKVTGAAITAVGVPVYVSDDNNLTITAPANAIPIGRTAQYETTGYMWVQIGFDVPLKGAKVLSIPFTKNTSETDTTVNLPVGAVVLEAYVDVVTEVAEATIDVGMLSSESGGDADGLIDGASCATAGKILPILVNATGASTNTLGALLRAHQGVKTADGTANYVAIKQPFVVTTAVSVSYTTSDHAVAGNIIIVYVEA